MQYDHLTRVKTLILQFCTSHCQRQCLTKRSKTQILQCYVSRRDQKRKSCNVT